MGSNYGKAGLALLARYADIDEHAFTAHSHTDEHGRTHTWRLADTEVTLEIAEGPRAPRR